MAPLPTTLGLSLLVNALLSVFVSGQPGIVGLEFTRYEDSQWASASRQSQKRAETPSATVYNSQGSLLYLVNTTVGTPPQNIALQLDTGSSDIWLPWVGSKLCAQYKDCVSGFYDDTTSSTFKQVAPDQFSISYVDGTKIVGDYINETFGVGGVTLSKMTMGIAKMANVPGSDERATFQGIIGVGFDSGEAIVSQSGSGLTYPNIISQLVLQGKISTRAYSLWLNDLNSPSGNILFGGVDDSKYAGELTILPLQNNTQTGVVDTFTVTFHGLTIAGTGGKTVYNATRQIPVILDSGTTLTYLPDDMASAIMNGVGASDTELYGTVVPCSVGDSQGVLNFQFGSWNGPIVAAKIAQFVLPFPSDIPVPKFKNGGTACRWGILPAAENPNLFGDTFLRSAYVVYNIEGRQVGIAGTKFNVSESNIKQITAVSVLPGATSTASGVAQQTRSGPIYQTSGLGSLPSGAATTAAGTATAGSFDLGPSTSTASISASTDKTGKKGAAARMMPPFTSYVSSMAAVVSMFCGLMGGLAFVLL